jgi:hypothetical protein
MAVVAALVAFGLIAGVVQLAVGRDDGGAKSASRRASNDPSTSSTASSTPATAPASDLDAVVAEISAFVAKERHLAFDHPVAVTLLGDAAFAERVAADALEDEKQLTETEGVLRAVGLLDADVHLDEVLSSFLGAGVAGFYDPTTDELVVRGASVTPYVRVTLAHELTHALDDQHFELDRPALDDADDERGFAFSSLVEGNAVRIQDRYRSSLSKEERQQADDEEGRLSAGLDLSKIPRVIPGLIDFPYIFGPGLVERLVRAGGEARVDAAFADPPMTSEQIVDPDGWLTNRATPRTVPKPTADGAVFDEGALGFWGVYLLLEDELGQQRASQAALGWGGDWYVAWKQGAAACVRATFVMDTSKDLAELTSGLDDWAPAQVDATVTRGDDRVSFTSCG